MSNGRRRRDGRAWHQVLRDTAQALDDIEAAARLAGPDAVADLRALEFLEDGTAPISRSRPVLPRP